MKNASVATILILALTISLMSIVIFNGIHQARAEVGKNQQDNKTQVNTPKQQINNCIKNTPYKNLDCNNVLVYGVVCMPGSVCKLERFDIPFDLVTPY
jgi:hypothetical protein